MRLAADITRAVSDPVLRARAVALGEKIRAEHGVEQGVGLIQKIHQFKKNGTMKSDGVLIFLFRFHYTLRLKFQGCTLYIYVLAQNCSLGLLP